MNLHAALRQNEFARSDELADLLSATADAYARHFPSLRSIILFGGITLGEFHPHYSDIDLAVVFEDQGSLPANRLPEAIQREVHRLPLFGNTCIRPKHAARSILDAMRSWDWQSWTAETADAQTAGVTETSYPFTLCDTWMLHHHGITLAGGELLGEFPFQDAPPTTPEIELAQVKRYAESFALGRPFSIGAGELAGEVIYYATTFTRAIYTVRTGQVIGRVAGTRWYAETFPGEIGRFARRLGELRCAGPQGVALPDNSPELLWALFTHYAREALAYARTGVTVPVPAPSPAEFPKWFMKRSRTRKGMRLQALHE